MPAQMARERFAHPPGLGLHRSRDLDAVCQTSSTSVCTVPSPPPTSLGEGATTGPMTQLRDDVPLGEPAGRGRCWERGPRRGAVEPRRATKRRGATVTDREGPAAVAV